MVVMHSKYWKEKSFHIELGFFARVVRLEQDSLSELVWKGEKSCSYPANNVPSAIFTIFLDQATTFVLHAWV